MSKLPHFAVDPGEHAVDPCRADVGHKRFLEQGVGPDHNSIGVRDVGVGEHHSRGGVIPLSSSVIKV